MSRSFASVDSTRPPESSPVPYMAITRSPVEISSRLNGFPAPASPIRNLRPLAPYTRLAAFCMVREKIMKTFLIAVALLAAMYSHAQTLTTGGGGAATNAAQVIAFFTGCSGTLYLGADGACHTAGGAGVTSVGLSLNTGATCGAAAVTGSPVTTSGMLNINFVGVSGDVVTFNGSNCPQDSGTLLSAMAPLASPVFTGTPTIPLPFTISGGTSGGVLCETSTTNITTSNLLTTNTLTKGKGAGVCLANSSITDSATLVSTASPIQAEDCKVLSCHLRFDWQNLCDFYRTIGQNHRNPFIDFTRFRVYDNVSGCKNPAIR
jgi:hypothetical protein